MGHVLDPHGDPPGYEVARRATEREASSKADR
jgi:hypothetical protein